MRRGTLYLFQGPMSCSKSEHLLISIRKATTKGKKDVVAFKPTGDTQHPGKIASRVGDSIDAHEIPDDNPRQILRAIERLEEKNKQKYDIVAVDEVHFFQPIEFFWTIRDLLHDGYDVMAAGLTMNFRGEPFGPMLHLAELTAIGNIFRPTAWCKCGQQASFSQRLLSNGEIAPWDSPEKVPGDITSEKQEGAEKPEFIYAARCERCFVRPPL